MIVLLILISMAVVLLTSMAAATVYISESNGAGEVVTDNISNVNFGSVDQPNIVAANHPIIQSEYSFGKYLRFKVDSLGTSTTIKDLRNWMSAGALVTGERIREQNATLGVVTYAQPTQASIGTNSIPVADPGSANVDIAGNLAGTITAPDIGTPAAYSGYFLVQLQTNVGGTTPVGPVNQKTITLQFDES